MKTITIEQQPNIDSLILERQLRDMEAREKQEADLKGPGGAMRPLYGVKEPTPETPDAPVEGE